MSSSTFSSASPIELVISPRAHDIGDLEVRRALPVKERRMVGPFIFFDQMGPAILPKGRGLNVRPHPHIGLSTITWLFEGEIRHRDSLGYDMVIRPGEVNWMTAGSGIVHSERSPINTIDQDVPLAGIQTWVALPIDKEEIAPSFQHYTADRIPHLTWPGIKVALIIGSAWEKASPVVTQSETLYADIQMEAKQTLSLPNHVEERAVYVYDGSIEISGETYHSGSMLVLKTNTDAIVNSLTACRLMLLGGAPLKDGPRYVNWNFVSSSKERIEQAREDWKNGRFEMVKGDKEFIPLPD